MSHKYRYTQEDVLRGEPYHYHYTPYEGTALLPAYRSERLHALARLSARADSAELAGGATAPGVRRPPCAGVMDRPVDTVNELASFSAWVAAGGDAGDPELVDFVDSLVRKFEVSKRLRKQYLAGIRMERSDGAAADAYCYLAYLVARRSGGADLLWRLNTLLKLSDLVTSTDVEQFSPTAAAAMVEALHIELDMVSRLASDKGVPMG